MPIRAVILAAALAVSPAFAQEVDPARTAVVAGFAEDAAAAIEAASQLDPVTQDVVTWLALRDGLGSFDDYRGFVLRRSDWPGMDTLRAKAEPVIEKGHNAGEVIAWFAGNLPQTGAGTLRLAEALLTTGAVDAARAVLRRAWIELDLSREGHDALLSAFPDLMAPYHFARADALLWRGQATQAGWMLDVLPEDRVGLIAARIAYQRDADDLGDAVVAVPSGQRLDAGLAHDRFEWLASKGEWTEAVEILADRSTSASALGEPQPWASYRRILARWEMREGRANSAYQLASRHYLRGGADYADLEWLAGYVALTYLGDPTQALEHFDNALREVSSPISTAKMQYWRGRSFAMKQDVDAAVMAYSAAAEHQTAFYGLLAAEKLGRGFDPQLVGGEVLWQGAPVFDLPLVQAAVLLLAAEERGAAYTFFAHLGEALPAESLSALGAYLVEIDETFFALVLGKAGAARGIILPEIYFPLHDLAQMDLPVEPALALSIARRESEFNAGVASPVGALGLMQLMPATAEEVAGKLDLPFERAKLTGDWSYNAILGSAYLAELQAEFGASPVMIAAAYNAGPSRPKQWIEERGDPRLRHMDVVDWIEHIPFRETRNYVMRVTESLPIYRARLTGDGGALAFTALLVGEKPLLRPVARPTVRVVDRVPDVRPIARPRR